jgi:hypothetical protein
LSDRTEAAQVPVIIRIYGIVFINELSSFIVQDGDAELVDPRAYRARRGMHCLNRLSGIIIYIDP